MALDKAIKSGKEHRKPYYGSAAFDPSCRKGDCPCCKGNKLYGAKKRELEAFEKEKDADL